MASEKPHDRPSLIAIFVAVLATIWVSWPEEYLAWIDRLFAKMGPSMLLDQAGSVSVERGLRRF